MKEFYGPSAILDALEDGGIIHLIIKMKILYV